MPCCGGRRKSYPGGEKSVRSLKSGECSLNHYKACRENEAASPLAPGDKYSPHHQQYHQATPSGSVLSGTTHTSTSLSSRGGVDTPSYYHPRSLSRSPEDEEEILVEDLSGRGTPREITMTGNGFVIQSSGGSSGGLMKSKSGSLPDRYSARGFRDTFVSSMTPPIMSNSANSSPHHHLTHRTELNNSPGKELPNKENPSSGSGNKKWTFGGLFKRKSKTPSVVGSPSPLSTGSLSMSASPSPAPGSGLVMTNGFPPNGATVAGGGGYNNEPRQLSTGNGNPSTPPAPSANTNSATASPKYVSTPTQTRQKGKLSESDLSSEDSELENESWSRSHPQVHQQSQSQQPVSFKQNFLTRRLSRRREKAAAKKKAAEEHGTGGQPNGLLKVPQHPRSGQLTNGKRVGSSPDSLNNGTVPSNIFSFGSNGPWPSWEITKKVPILQAPNNNYSSSGSLSLSFEGSTKGSRAAAKEAVKARAVARRESFFQDSSSEDDGEDHSRSSIQGSHSSLSSRNRKKPLVMSGNASSGGGSTSIPKQTLGQVNNPSFRPASDYTRASPASSSPAKFDYQNNNHQSPSFNRRVVGPAPGSPRWEARVVYTQVNVENDTPFVVKLPKGQTVQDNNTRSRGYVTSTDPTAEENQQVITAGLRVPISGQAQQTNGQYITEEVHYANLPNQNLRQRSATPQGNYPRGYNNVSPSPPPPPPRRDFNRPQGVNGLNKSQTNPNFYRPVSCSYLDAYEGFYQQQQQMMLRNNGQHPPSAAPSPNLNNVNPSVMSFTPVHQNVNRVPPTNRHYYDQSQNGNYYFGGEEPTDQVDNSRDFTSSGKSHSSFLGHKSYSGNHPNLVRFPSEPPEIKIQGVREQSPLKRNASTPSPSPYNQQSSHHLHHLQHQQGYYSNGPDNSHHLVGDEGASNGIGKTQQPVIMSKLGFPVRRLHEAGKIPLAQSPVHLRASEFWRKKEAEVTGIPAQPNPNHKKYMNRIRSADSSPLPIPRMRGSPANNIQNSNESISSLSSFSAESPHHHMFLQSNNGKTIVNPGLKITRRNLGGNPTQSLYNNNPNNSHLSLNQVSVQPPAHAQPGTSDHGLSVNGSNGGESQYSHSHSNGSGSRSGGGGGGGNNHANQTNERRNDGNSSQNQNGGGNGGGRAPGNNNSSTGGNDPPPPGNNANKKEKTPSAVERLKVRAPSVPPMMTGTSGSNKETQPHKIVRSLVDLNNGKTPGRNLEDALNELEDMYKSLRLSDEDLLDRAERRDLPTPHQELRNAPLIPLPSNFRFEPLGSVESLATGSSSGGSGTNYSSDNPNNPTRVRAPPLRRSSRPDTVSDDMARRRCYQTESKALDPRNVVSKTGSYMVLSPAFSPPVSPCPPETLPLSIISYGNPDEPDITLDDVTFRHYRAANSIRIIDPQPPFGIPLGPITAAPGTDYLHSKRSDRLRPLFKATKNPDLVNDDIAFRNLRKDLNTDNNLSKDWTPRLFSPTRDNNVFSFNNGVECRDKKVRAVRSLSANITNFIPFTGYSFNSSELGKWNSFTDLHHQRQSTSSPLLGKPQQKRRASTYLQPSWVEQIEKVQTSTETLTENRNSNNKFAYESELLQQSQQWERKLPTKTVQLTPDLYDPTKPRRPWTDIILDSFEKEKQNEIEQIAEEAAAAAAASANVDSTTNSTTNDNETLHNDDTMGVSRESHPPNNRKITGENHPHHDDDDDDDVFEPHNNNGQLVSSQSCQDGRQPSEELSKSTTSNIYQHTPEVRLIEATVMDMKDALMDGSAPGTTTTGSPPNLPLLLGQKTRRGSWVEPRTYSASHLSSSDNGEEDKRRKSWSYLPKEVMELSEDLGGLAVVSSSSSSRLFTPLPPPRKIKQISLFSSSGGTTGGNEGGGSSELSPSTPTKAINEVNYLKEREDKVKTGGIPSSPRNIRGEEELNELMDMLQKEADTCGPVTNPPSEEEEPSATTTTTRSAEDGANEKVNCSSKQRVKPSLSSEVTQKDTTDGNRTSLPKIPQSESSSEPTKNEEDSLLRESRMTLAPEIVSVIRKSTSSSVSLPHPSAKTPSKKGCPPHSDQIDKTQPTIVGVMRSSPKPLPIITPATTASSSSLMTTKSCSIEELIDSINESLPELEASCTSHKSNESSLSSVPGSSPPSVPSPRPGSPTTITFPVRTSATATATTPTTTAQQQTQDFLDQLEEELAECTATAKEMGDGKRKESISGHGNESVTRMDCAEKADEDGDESRDSRKMKGSASRDDETSGGVERGSVAGAIMVKKSPEETSRSTNERSLVHQDEDTTQPTPYYPKRPERYYDSPKESSPGIKGSFPFLRTSTSRSRSQSLIKSMSNSPTTSEFGESKREKDKSHKRKSHLNRAFTEEPVPQPDTTSSPFHLSPHAFNHESRASLESSNANSGAEDLTMGTNLGIGGGNTPAGTGDARNNQANRKSTASIYKVPTIPSILTTNKSPSPMNTNPISNSPIQLPPSPTLKHKGGIAGNKMQNLETRKSSPVVKKDSFSDAEGVSFIKKLLQKESLEKAPNSASSASSVSASSDLKVKHQPTKDSSLSSGFVLKKSSSVGSNSYWSKFSNSQPAFLKKFFDKHEKPMKEVGESETKSLAQQHQQPLEPLMSSTPPPFPSTQVSPPSAAPLEPETEPVLGFSVAQKASFFMKLEHEQRFSKWRKNSLECSTPTNIPANMQSSDEQSQASSTQPLESHKSRSSRQLTQPVTIMEVQQAANIVNADAPMKPASPPVPPSRKSRTPLNIPLQFEGDNENQLAFGNYGYDGSTYNEDGTALGEVKVEPFKLSLKDRVNMFDKLTTPGVKAPSAATTPYPMSAAMQGTFPMNHSSSAVISSNTPMSFYNSSSQSSLYGNHGPFSNSNAVELDMGLAYNNGELDQTLCKRRGSTSDLELSSTPKYSPVPKRNSKTRSMFVSDDGSEDGEVSSGGQEVSEIISRSYENSPIAKKKTWKAQQKQSQASFTKEIWRRCKVNDNWSWKWNGSQESPKKSKPTTYKVTTNVSHQVVSSCVLPNQAMLSQHPVHPQSTSIQLPSSYLHQQQHHQQTQGTVTNVSSSETTPPATSNLLQILTVLSSSNDELSESHSKSSSSKISRADKFMHNVIPDMNSALTSSSATHCPINASYNTTTTNVTHHHQVTVPHPDDESFQTFFSSRTSTNNYLGDSLPSQSTSASHEAEMDVVQRESGMLVMKKNLPIVRRKSVGKSRNPLKALAARIDFHNQWYTDSGSGEPPNGPAGNPSMF